MKKINPERLRTYDLYKILKMTKYSDGGPLESGRGGCVWEKVVQTQGGNMKELFSGGDGTVLYLDCGACYTHLYRVYTGWWAENYMHTHE